jgi:hypothetical protein
MRPFRTPNPFTVCPDCGAPPHVAHHDDCRWSYTNMRSKLSLTLEEALMHETEEPQPAPQPDPEPDTEGGDEEE